MNFKEALIAHLQGEKVWSRFKRGEWIDFARDFKDVNLERFCEYYEDSRFEFRIVPHTIFVNGVEVPAPESVAPKFGEYYFSPASTEPEMFKALKWCNDRIDVHCMNFGLVYLNKEDSIARAKAMLLTSDKQQEQTVLEPTCKMAEKKRNQIQSGVERWGS